MIHTEIIYRVAQGFWLGLIAYTVFDLIHSVRADKQRQRRQREQHDATNRWHADGGQ